ncbi:MAG: S8 family peptidase [Calditrichaeota bacterium]|nr:S8 family peptidase [Calditrichota bacterium]MCB9365723.1 S8 family peptidase [Calditrichota bacterium]
MKRIALLMLLMLAVLASAKQKPVSSVPEPYYNYVPNQVLVAFAEGTSQAAVDGVISRSGGHVGTYSDLLDFYRIEGVNVEKSIEYFRAQKEVLWANYNYIARMQFVPNDDYYQYQWHYPLIGMEQAWDITRGNPNVVVAVLDQGYQFDHEDWVGVQTVSPYDFISGDNNPAEPNLEDSHGMHTGGTIFARTNNNTGVAGIAPNCTMMPVRVLDNEGSGSIEAIANGFAWAAQQGADVVNASLGFGNPNNQPPQDPGPPLTGAVQQCANANVIMAVSSGNDNADYVSYPAAYTACIAVGATALNNAIAPYSNRGSQLDVTAPGGNVDQDLNQDGYIDGVLSTVRAASQGGDYYTFWQGTSMAAPHVAGLAALILSNGCPPTQVRNAIQNTCVDLGAAGWDVVFGFGRINAAAALQYDCSGGGGETVLFDGPMESGTEGWLVEEAANNGVGWQFLSGTSPDCSNQPHGGSDAIWHDDEQGIGLQDDWLYTPEITIPANATDVTLSFWQRNCYLPTYYDLHGLYYSTNSQDFTLIDELDNVQTDWEQITVDATSLAGNDVYFAWRYRGDYATEWFLDDVRVTAQLGTGIGRETDLTIPEQFTLGNPYPNPFNSTVQIPFELATPQEISLSIFNVLGQKVATLVKSERLDAGSHRMMWNGDAAASGLYLVQLQSGTKLATQKILLVK